MESSARRGAEVPDVRCRDPYYTCAQTYVDQGWLVPLPLPEREKVPPPTDWTGGPMSLSKMTAGALRSFIKESKGRRNNICVWAPPGLLGIDVDHYAKTKSNGVVVQARGYNELMKLQRELGRLPRTWTSSGRSDGKSGIRWFKIPVGLHIPGKLSDSIDLVHSTYRYGVVAPSFNPASQDFYRWYAPGKRPDGSGSFEVPDASTLPELPEAWVEFIRSASNHKHLKAKRLSGSVTESSRLCKEFLDRDAGDEPCNAMFDAITRFKETVNDHNIHDRAAGTQWRILTLREEGHSGASAAFDLLWEAWEMELARDDSPHGSRSADEIVREFDRSRDQGVRKVMALIDESYWEGFPEECSCPPLGPSGRPMPVISVSSARAGDVLPKLYEACSPVSGVGLYTRSDDVVLYRGAERHAGQPTLERMSADSVLPFLDSRVLFQTAGNGDFGPMPAMAPERIVRSMLASGERYRYLPNVQVVATAPLWVWEEGVPVLISTSGFHRESGVLMELPPELEGFRLERKPSAADVKSARERIADVFSEFPFDSPGSRANLLAALLAVPTRPLVRGNAPAYLFEAPTPRTGKTLCAEVISIITCGGVSHENGVERYFIEKHDKAQTEFAKSFVAAGRESPQIMFGDNLDFHLDSSVFAGAMTTYPEFQSRKLGTSDILTLRTDNTHFLTANQMTISNENIPRVVSIRLDAKTERPDRDRTFKITNMQEYVSDHRVELLIAIHTLIAHWVNRRCPRETALTMGGFETWVQVMGGILGSFGQDNLLGNRDEFEARARTDEETGSEAFVREWVETFGIDAKITPEDILSLPSVGLVVSSKYGADPTQRKRDLGQAIRRLIGPPIKGHYINKRSVKGYTQYWVSGPGFTKNRRRSGEKARWRTKSQS